MNRPISAKEAAVIEAARALRDRIDELGQRGPRLADDVAAVIAAVDALDAEPVTKTLRFTDEAIAQMNANMTPARLAPVRHPERTGADL